MTPGEEKLQAYIKQTSQEELHRILLNQLRDLTPNTMPISFKLSK